MTGSWEICLDASLIMRRVQPRPSDQALRAWRSFASAKARLHAPTLAYYEVVNGLYRSTRSGLLSQQAAARTLRTALSMPITWHGDDELHREALQSAIRHDLPAAYAAHYVALAERLAVELWTADTEFVKAVEARLPWVRLVS